MKSYSLHTNHRKLLADTLTPVGIYLRIRDHFAQTLMLESSDYHGSDNSFSYICFDPIAQFSIQDNKAHAVFPDGTETNAALEDRNSLTAALNKFISAFDVETLDFNFLYNGLFGYQSYDTVRFYEDVAIDGYESEDRQIPDLLYHLYRYVIVINHFKNELYVFEHLLNGEESTLGDIISLLQNRNVPRFSFSPIAEESSNFNDHDFLHILRKGIDHCQKGDVFQIVLSRQFSQAFNGDEFNVYRCLRSINPSPYLFYADFGNFKLMGSSPEAQLVIEGQTATIHPIAGTFRRTGNDDEDSRLARELLEDPKENSEHVMLVDLARNDLSRNGSDVRVETYKEVQYYSHVIHLVSRVSANILPEVNPLQLVADTFPAGTLSGAPKHRAMQLINVYENQNRGFYGGCIGCISFNGDFNHAIVIRSFLSKGNRLYYQAGAGIVAKSNPQSELNEVDNKLGALRHAIQMAAELNKEPEKDTAQ